jgi:hypothetical protein
VPPTPAEADRLAARVAALNLILQGLLERLLLAGTLDPGDLGELRKFAAAIASDLRAQVPGGFGAATEAEVDAFFDAMGGGRNLGAH